MLHIDIPTRGEIEDLICNDIPHESSLAAIMRYPF